MQIARIKSIELNREKLFDHKIVIKDKDGWVLDTISVKEHNENEVFKMVVQKWLSHPSSQPEPPTEQELYERRKK